MSNRDGGDDCGERLMEANPTPEPSTDTVDMVIETVSVSLLPVDHPERRHFSLVLERRPGDRFVVKDGFRGFLAGDGSWTAAADVTDEWRSAHWHTWADAVRLACAEAAEIVVNGRTAADVLRTEPLPVKGTP